jgi:hypothetical protein
MLIRLGVGVNTAANIIRTLFITISGNRTDASGNNRVTADGNNRISAGE